MRSPIEGNTPRVPNSVPEQQSSNAFSKSFLQADLDLNEPAAIDDPEGEGPWLVLPASPDGWPEPWEEVHGMWPLGERPERGDPPAFLSSGRSVALCASIARPVAGRDPLYGLGQEKWRGGFPLLRQGRPEAWMGSFFPEWALITSALLSLGQRPEAVAVYLEALGPSCRRRIGAILYERLLGARR
ncbi:MAG TPA: hypothetical protein VEL74_24365 [Thermoanaerobaculia bacterium]|nr:hypothetical protein [Thermoanaerobaculia bacterium]